MSYYHGRTVIVWKLLQFAYYIGEIIIYLSIHKNEGVTRTKESGMNEKEDNNDYERVIDTLFHF